MYTAINDWFSAFIQYDLREQQHVLFIAAIRHKMYQFVSKVLTFTKIPN